MILASTEKTSRIGSFFHLRMRARCVDKFVEPPSPARADSRFVTAIALVLEYHNIDADFWATLRACVETTEGPET